MINKLESSAVLGPTIFIVHASFELARSNYAANYIFSKTETVPDAVIVIANSARLESDQQCARSFLNLVDLAERSSHLYSITRNRAELLELLNDLNHILAKLAITNRHRFVVDISTFPKDRLWVIIDLIGNVYPDSPISIIYTEPEIYNTEQVVDGWLSKGVSEISPILGFNGRQNPIKPTLLILNIGHENERVTITVNNREPQKIILLKQSEIQHNTLSGASAHKILRKLQDSYGNIVEKDIFFEVDSHDPFAVRDRIQEISSRFHDEWNISVAMFGTKMQSIGALLACRENRRIEAVYARPQLYHAEAYSKGIGHCWVAAIK